MIQLANLCLLLEVYVMFGFLACWSPPAVAGMAENENKGSVPCSVEDCEQRD